MKKTIALLILLMVLILVIILTLKMGGNTKEEHVTITHDAIVKQIEGMGNLEVVKYNIQDVMEYEKARRWLPSSKTSIKVVGEVIACIDLTKIQPENIRTYGDSVSITLPLPEICSYKVDHSKSKVYNVEFGLWETAELVDDAYQHAEDYLYREALKMGIADESHANTIKVLTPILRSLGFTRIYIGFDKSLNQQPKTSEQPTIDFKHE